jgi:hypothetical protein
LPCVLLTVHQCRLAGWATLTAAWSGIIMDPDFYKLPQNSFSEDLQVARNCIRTPPKPRGEGRAPVVRPGVRGKKDGRIPPTALPLHLRARCSSAVCGFGFITKGPGYPIFLALADLRAANISRRRMAFMRDW